MLVKVILDANVNVEFPEFAETWRIPRSLLTALPVNVCELPPPMAKMILLLALLVTVAPVVTTIFPRNVISAAGSV